MTQGTSTTESYSYDAVGNRLSSSGVPTYNYNSSNELTSNSNGSYTYDANGNTLTDPSGKSYTWDFENRLIQAVVPGTNGGTTTFKYDPFGRRIQKSGPLGTINYLYEGDDFIEEVDNSGNLLARYTGGSGVDQTLAEQRSGTVSYVQQDGLGSVTSLSSSAGSLASTYVYDSYGNLSASTGTTMNPFEFTGRQSDPETSIYYYRARYYDPSIGRFSGEDPSRFDAGPNFYEYVNNSPTNLIDPFGLQSQTPLPPGCYPPFATPCGPPAYGPPPDPTPPPPPGAPGPPVGWDNPNGPQSGQGSGQGSTAGSAAGAEPAPAPAPSRTIPQPSCPSRGCTCTCRADADDTQPGNVRPGLPRFAFGTATASNCSDAKKAAKRIATHALGMKPKHIPCKCTQR